MFRVNVGDETVSLFLAFRIILGSHCPVRGSKTSRICLQFNNKEYERERERDTPFIQLLLKMNPSYMFKTVSKKFNGLKRNAFLLFAATFLLICI